MDVIACLYYGVKISEEENRHVYTTTGLDEKLETLGVTRDCSGDDDNESFLYVTESNREENDVADCLGDEITTRPEWKGQIENALHVAGIDPGSRPVGWYLASKLV